MSYKGKDKEAIKEAVYKQGTIITASMNKDKQVGGHFPELGLCNRCSYLRGVVSEYGTKGASCFNGMVKLTGRLKVRECSSFWDRTYVEIQSLLDMSPLLIDPKETIGF